MSNPNDDSLAPSTEAEADVAVLEPSEASEDVKSTGRCCEKCGAPSKSDLVTVCRRCGWYPSLNRFVELDQDFEALHEDTPEDGQPRPKQSHLQVWASLLPRWSWILIATVLAIVAESLVARFVTEADSSERMRWSVIQLAIGVAVFLGCHIFNFLVSATEDAEVGFLDVFIKPFALWLRAMRNLPRRLWVTDGALAGATAAAMSILVIGSIPYDSMFDWGGKAKKPNLLASVVKNAQKIPGQGSGGNLAEAVGGVPANGGGSDNLEDAVGDLAGQDLPTEGSAGEQDISDAGDGNDKNDELAKAKQDANPDERHKIVCVILGYRLDAQRHISALVLGAPHDDKLAYAAVVTTPPDDATLIDLVDDLERSQVLQPAVPTYVQATWVRPEFVCQVDYQVRETDGRLIDAKWEKLRGTLQAPVFARPAPASTP
jgi:hypothetical protein